MKMKIVIGLLVVALVPLLASCVVTSKETHVDISCEEFTDNPTGTRNEFTIGVGDKVYVDLCSNPTTGFSWSYEMTGDPAVREEDHDFEEPDSDLLGAAGKEMWTFEGVEKGTAEITMVYEQPWEDGTKQEWTYKLTITVE